MSDLTFINGKFYNGSEPVPLIFGDKDQIRILERIDEAKDWFIPIREFESAGIAFKCFCGTLNNFEGIGTFSCKGCKIKYQVAEDEEIDCFIMRIKSLK